MTTPDQEQAIRDIETNLVVSAGAGAGKTYVLVQRFVNVLLSKKETARLNAVVAITFTRAAAMEMRERIRAELEKRYHAGGPDSARCGDLLGQMDSARIDTIHSLCATIVRANAAEAGVDPQFEVMDATQQRLRLNEIINDTLLFSQDAQIGRLVKEYGLDRVREQLQDQFTAPLSANIPTAASLLAQWQQRPDYGGLDLDQHARLTVAWDYAIRKIRAAYQADKQMLKVLDFDDLEQMTVDLLNRSELIRARYQGSEFSQLLVDEFQDTNGAQWDIVKALGDLQKPGTLFIVGDVKQSIYGFRRADVRVFADVKTQIEAHGGRPLKLATSFRSNPALITLFNALFQKMLIARPQSEAHAYHVEFDHPMTVHRQDRVETPAMRVLMLRKKPDELKPYPPRSQGLPSNLRRTWEGEEIARQILALAGTPIYDRERRTHRDFEFGDVAILMRSLNHASHYEEALQRAGIPYVTFSGKGFYGLQEIYDLQNMLRVLHNTQDSLSLAAVLRSPLFGVSDETLFALRRLRELDADPYAPIPVLWGQLQWVADRTFTLFLPELEQTRLERAVDIILKLQAAAGRSSSAELLRAIFAETGYLAVVNSLPQGAQRRRNLEKLLDNAQNLSQMSPAAFTHYLTQLAASGSEIHEGEAAMEAEGVVKLMTVHASKGLEFPVVFLADASPHQEQRAIKDFVVWDERGAGQLLCRLKDSSLGKDAKAEKLPPPDFLSYQTFVQEKEAAEELRLLYVAATRARDMFYISGEVKEDKQGFTANGWLGAMLRTLGLSTAQHEQVLTWANERIQTFVPPYPDHLPRPSQRPDDSSSDENVIDTAPLLQAAWEHLNTAAAVAVPTAPALLPPVSVEPRKFAEHLAATQLAAFGAARSAQPESKRPHYRSAARRTVLYDVPGIVRAAVRPYDPRVTQRIIGDMVHEALRFERYPSRTPNLDQILTSYAWNKGLTQAHDLEDAKRRAHSLLRRFEQESDVYQWIQAAKAAKTPIYRELPFIYRLEGRILHGVIDILFQRPTGEWVIIDYKTGYVPYAAPRVEPDYARHSHRYYLQVGAYAKAVEAYVGVEPMVYIHYLRYCKTEPIPTTAWQNAIRALESAVIDVMGTGT